MEEFIRMHKDAPFGWVLAIEMGALWLQVVLAARSAAKNRRDMAGRRGRESEPKTRPHDLPRLMAPR